MTQSIKPPSLREQQKANTRAELTRKGMELFLKQGFESTTIEQIVEPLGIAKRTFFRYFKTKEDVVFGFYEDKTPLLVEYLQNRPAQEDAYTAVCQTLAMHLELYDANPQQAWALVRLIQENPALAAKGFEKRSEREERFADALLQRSDAADASPIKARVIVGIAMLAWEQALKEWHRLGGKQDLRPIVERAFEMATPNEKAL